VVSKINLDGKQFQAYNDEGDSAIVLQILISEVKLR